MSLSLPRNPAFDCLPASYLFAQVKAKVEEYLTRNNGSPPRPLISLGVGDTVLPLPPSVSEKMKTFAEGMATKEGYFGYVQRNDAVEMALKTKIVEVMYRGVQISPSEVHISDGSKPDLGRLMLLFGSDCRVAIQDPAYPVYLDGATLASKRGKNSPIEIVKMPCNDSNGWFPEFTESLANSCDLVFVCNPNNPTGASASREQLEEMVRWGVQHKKLIVYDVAYHQYIQNPSLPKSIFEIQGADQCCIESNSFSKTAGLTGVRLGWLTIPKLLKFSGGEIVGDSWKRLCNVYFGGASVLAMNCGIACLENLEEVMKNVEVYMKNSKLLKHCFESLGFPVVGGEDAPFLFVNCASKGKTDWEFFQDLLEKCQIIGVPGSGFGQGGEGWLRLGAYATEEEVGEVVKRLEECCG